MAKRVKFGKSTKPKSKGGNTSFNFGHNVKSKGKRRGGAGGGS